MNPIEETGLFSADDSWKVHVAEFEVNIDEAASAYSKKRSPSAPVVEYYENMKAMISRYKTLGNLQETAQQGNSSPLADNGEEDDDEDAGANPDTVDFGAKASFALNIVLLVLKSFAAYRTGSTTILASLLDSVLDILSGGIMILVGYLLKTSSEAWYPTGKHHFEPLGTLVFACAMFVAATKLIQNCVEEMININQVAFSMDAQSLLILAFVICTKSVACWWCFRNAHGSCTLTALAEDHRNDIVANIVALVGFIVASQVTVWADPLLGLGVTFFILSVWGRTIKEQLHSLSGHLADPEIVNQIIMIARNHHPDVVAIDTVRVVTSGTGYVVEVDIVLPPNMPLWQAHNIGESLQVFLESVRKLQINRAYVHLDTETDHDPKRHL